MQVVKFALSFPVSGRLNHFADRSKKRVVALAEIEAWEFHFAGLLFDVAPIWSDIQFWNDA
jgi:hypothetical protein